MSQPKRRRYSRKASVPRAKKSKQSASELRRRRDRRQEKARPAGTAADTLVELRQRFERRPRLPAGRMLADGAGLYSGHGLLLPFAPLRPWRGEAWVLDAMPPSAAGGG